MVNRRDQALAKTIMKRDGGKCTFCGKTDGLEAHHIIPVACGGPDVVENLITVCKSCHKKLTPTGILGRLSQDSKARFKKELYALMQKKLDQGEWGLEMVFDAIDEL